MEIQTLYEERKRRVNVYTLTDEFVRYFDGVNDTSKGLKLYRSNIIAVCKGRRKSTGGYKFKYGD